MKNIFFYSIFMLTLITIIYSCYSNNINNNLIGTWEGCIIDLHTQKPIDSLKMKFDKDNKLTYIIGFGNNKQTINLKFRTDNNFIYTQEFNSNEEDKAKYSIEKDLLVLNFEGQNIKLIKIQ